MPKMVYCIGPEGQEKYFDATKIPAGWELDYIHERNQSREPVIPAGMKLVPEDENESEVPSAEVVGTEVSSSEEKKTVKSGKIKKGEE